MTADEFENVDPRWDAVVGGEIAPVPDSLIEARLATFGTALRTPTTEAELAGFGEALEALQARGRARTSRRPVRTLAVVGAGMSAILLVGGVAAAATGNLPAPLQRLAHSALGAPVAAGEHKSDETHVVTSTSATPTGSTTSGRPGHGRPSAGASGLPTPAAGSVGNSALGLCRAWRSHGKPINPNSAIVRGLTPLAGAAGIQIFCTGLLAPISHPSLTPPGHGHSVSPTPPAPAGPSAPPGHAPHK